MLNKIGGKTNARGRPLHAMSFRVFYRDAVVAAVTRAASARIADMVDLARTGKHLTRCYRRPDISRHQAADPGCCGTMIGRR